MPVIFKSISFLQLRRPQSHLDLKQRSNRKSRHTMSISSKKYRPFGGYSASGRPSVR